MAATTDLLFRLVIAIVIAQAVVCRSVQTKDYESTEETQEQEVDDELESFLPVHGRPSTSSQTTQPPPTTTDLCASIFCGNGRECVLTNGLPTCGCALQCPHHYKPICGSDGVTYGNPCELHRAACLQNARIHKHLHGPCPGPPPTLEPQPEEMKPLVCYELERDQLRQLLIDWMKGRVQDYGAPRSGESYASVLTEKFRDCDVDGDDQLDAAEFIQCVEKNETIVQFKSDHPEQRHVLRGLCVDALILMSDTNENWMLDLEEFFRCMDPNFLSPRKQCSLENKLYNDGAEQRVQCNICVCACGNWVCSAMSCDEMPDLFEPYDIENSPLPSKEERYALLRGFMGAEHINLDRIEAEVPPARYEHHYNTQDMDAVPMPVAIPDTLPAIITDHQPLPAFDEEIWYDNLDDNDYDADDDEYDVDLPELLIPPAKEERTADSDEALHEYLTQERETNSNLHQVQTDQPLLPASPQIHPRLPDHVPTATQRSEQSERPMATELEAATPQPAATTELPLLPKRHIPVVSFNMTVVEHRIIRENDSENSAEMNVAIDRIPQRSHANHHGNHHGNRLGNQHGSHPKPNKKSHNNNNHNHNSNNNNHNSQRSRDRHQQHLQNEPTLAQTA